MKYTSNLIKGSGNIFGTPGSSLYGKTPFNKKPFPSEANPDSL